MGGGKVILPLSSKDLSKSLQDMSLTFPFAPRQFHISHNATDSLLLPMPGFSSIKRRMSSILSSVISGLLNVFMPGIFDAKGATPFFHKKWPIFFTGDHLPRTTPLFV